MREPDNYTAVIDRFGDTWIRYDELPGRYGAWWPLTDGPGWGSHARNDIGIASAWSEVEPWGPFTEADAERAAAALARVREEATR